MNDSGKVVSMLKKKGIQASEVLVIHDELELPFGTVKERFGGSAKGHNGLKSLIQAMGPDFKRLRCGVGRPEHRQDVPKYVLENFSQDKTAVDQLITTAADNVISLIS
jgi:PTH1 family peptidyl-tRNA hydrolase